MAKAPAKASKPVAKAKPVATKSTKPVAKPIVKVPAKAAPAQKAVTPKAGSASKPKVVAKAAPSPAKPATPKVTAPVKVKTVDVKPVAAVVNKTPVKQVAPVTVKPVAKAASTTTQKPEPKPIIKSAPIVQAKAVAHQPGTKIADTIRKPAASGVTPVHKSFVSTEITKKVTPPIAAPSAKPFQKMIEKKEIKPFVSTSPDEPQKSRYSDSELAEFDQLIDQKLIIAREQLEFYLKQLEDMAENPDNKIKSLDDGLSSLESERISSMASRQQKLIQHLENAKIRIKNKVYGICRETGKLISKERLRAVPHATLSIEAKQSQN